MLKIAFGAANNTLPWNKVAPASEVVWRFRLGHREVMVEVRYGTEEVEVSTRLQTGDDEMRVLGRDHFTRSRDLVPYLMATKQGFLTNGWVVVE
jgi:hypothetical protein